MRALSVVFSKKGWVGAVGLLLWTLVYGHDSHILKGHMITRPTLEKHARPSPSLDHEVTIAITQLNMDKLESALLELSDPTSPTYQQWWTREQVAAAIDNPVGYNAVKAWLESNTVRVDWVSSSRHFIRATASVAQWEQLLNAEFHIWRDTHPFSAAHAYYRRKKSAADAEAEAGRTLGSSSSSEGHLESFVVLSEHYSVPVELHQHISGIFGTSQSPPIMTTKSLRRPSSPPTRPHHRPNTADQQQEQQQQQQQQQPHYMHHEAAPEIHAASRVESNENIELTAGYVPLSVPESASLPASASTTDIVEETEIDMEANLDRVDAAAREAEQERRRLLYAPGMVDPPFLTQLYQIGSLLGDSSQTQAVFEAEASNNLPYYSSADLKQFLGYFGYQASFKQPINYPESGSSFDTATCDPLKKIVCDEGNLDLQYISALAQNTQTVYWTSGGVNPFIQWAIDMYTDFAGPKKHSVLVTSISFGATEITVDDASIWVFDNCTIALGVLGK